MMPLSALLGRPRSLHPAHYLKLWDVVDDTIVTAQGCYFKGFRLEGLESESTPGDTLLKSAEYLYKDFSEELPDHTLLQFVMVSHGDHEDLWRAYQDGMPTEPVLAHQRRRRREHLQALDLRRHDLYVFVGLARPLTEREFGHVTPSRHEQRRTEVAELAEKVRALLGRASILCEALRDDELLALYFKALNPGARPMERWHRQSEWLGDDELQRAPNLRMRTLREFLMRSSVQWEEKHVQIGQRYHKVLTLDGLPEHTEFTLMEAFGALKMDFRLSITVRFPEQRRLVGAFQRSRRFANATAHKEHVEDEQRLAEVGEAEALSQELADTKQKLVLFGAQVVLSDATPYGLDKKVKHFNERMQRHGLRFFEETLAHDRELFKTLPGMAVAFDRFRVVTSNNAVDMLPLFCPPHGDRRPVLLLLTPNQEVYSFDPVEPIRDNWNGVVLGASGSGKSVLINMLITCAALGGPTRGRLMVVDFAGEKKSSYLMVARLFGGKYIPVMSSEGLAINPFPPPRLALREDGQLRDDTMSYLLSVTDCLLANEGDDKDCLLFRGILQDALADVYRRGRGSDLSRGNDDAPLYQDLVEVLRGYLLTPEREREQGRIHTLLDLLTAVLRGPGARLLNRPTSVTADNPFTIFDLYGVESLPGNVGQAVTCLVSQYVRQLAFDDKDNAQKYIFLDEAAQHIRSPRMVKLFEELYSTARKHHTSVWTISQTYSAFGRSSLADMIQNNSTTLALLSHATAERAREQIIADWGLSPREATLFRSLQSKKGLHSEILLRSEIYDAHQTKRPVSAKLRLLLSAFDYQLANSDAVYRAKQHNYIAANPHIPLHQVLEYVAASEAMG